MHNSSIIARKVTAMNIFERIGESIASFKNWGMQSILLDERLFMFVDEGGSLEKYSG